MTKQELITSENATIEDALNYFRNHCILCKSSNNCCNCEIGIAIECIEKQIPKEAKYHISGNGWNDWLVFTCPVCGKEFKDTLVCPRCCQAVTLTKEMITNDPKRDNTITCYGGPVLMWLTDDEESLINNIRDEALGSCVINTEV